MKYQKNYSLALFLFLFVFSVRVSEVGAAMPGMDINRYTADPSMLTDQANILLVVDESESMRYRAYGDTYVSTETYYGYFGSDEYYKYNTSIFEINAACGGNGPDCISGNILNWATMSRIDILRKALIGGKSIANPPGIHRLRSQGAGEDDMVTDWVRDDIALECRFKLSKGYNHKLTITSLAGKTCKVGTISNSKIELEISDADRKGIIQEIGSSANDGKDAPRFGLMVYARPTKPAGSGCMRVGIKNSTLDQIITAINDEDPEGSTYTGEALREAKDYFAQDAASNGGCDNAGNIENVSFIDGKGTITDPWYDEISGKLIPCKKNYVLLLSDGLYKGLLDPYASARISHMDDIRADIPGDSTLTHYVVHIFGAPGKAKKSMQQIAMFGGFDDFDGNAYPYPYTSGGSYPGSENVSLPLPECDPSGTYNDECREWDKDGNGIPDNFFGAEKASEVKEKIRAAIKNITSESSASGTSVAMMSSSFSAEREILQCYYLPKKKVNNKKLSWLGYMLSLKMDYYGHLRGGKDGKCINYTSQNGETMINTLGEDASNQKCTDTILSSVPLSSFENYAWEAGDELKSMNPDNRNIFTYIDNNKVDFKSTDTSIFPYLWDTGSGADLIDFIRGKKVASSRDKTITDIDGTNEWKLGDIIHSSPTIVGDPSEQYQLRYGDKTYGEFFDNYKNNPRKKVAYVGANDGMMHAICIDPAGCKTGVAAGQELWAFIPHNILPHLKWLKDPNYSHVYYVDLKAKVTDIKIGTEWKTILIGGMGFGGGEMANLLNASFPGGKASFRSSYFALDITNPNDPKILWEYSDADLGFTLSYPAIAHVDDKWFAIVGSGPVSNKGWGTTTPNGYEGESDKKGQIYVLDAATGNLLEKFETKANAFMSSSLAVDVDLKTEAVTSASDTYYRYNTEVVYIGVTYNNTGDWITPEWRGGVYRLALKGNPTPSVSNWGLSEFFQSDAVDTVYPVTTQPVAAFDEKKNLWVYFGTGRFFNDEDKEDITSQNRFYGIKEPCVSNKQWDTTCSITIKTDDLVDSSNIEVTDINSTSNPGKVTGAAEDDWYDFVTEASKKRGWYYNLSLGTLDKNGSERVVTKPVIVAGLIIFATSIPDTEICGSGGTSRLYSLYYKTGTAYMTETIKDPADATPPEIVKSSIDIDGLISSPSVIAKGKTLSVVAQKSDGSIITISSPLAVKKSRIRSWKTF